MTIDCFEKDDEASKQKQNYGDLSVRASIYRDALKKATKNKDEIQIKVADLAMYKKRHGFFILRILLRRMWRRDHIRPVQS